MSDAIYTFARGSTIRLALDVTSGSAAAVTGLTAALRRVDKPGALPGASVAVAAQFAVQARAANGAVTDGWDLTIPPSVSSVLTAGFYAADARIAFGSDDADITRAWTIVLTEAVTRP